MAGTAAKSKADSYRRRLVAGMAASVSEKGLAATTIGDVVERAGMSKRSFYEHFADKEACFLALYSIATDRLIAGMEQAMSEPAGTVERVRRGLHAFTAILQGEPALTRAHFVEIYTLGERGLAARRAVLRKHAEAWQAAVERDPRTPDGAVLPDSTATAMIGGIHELVLQAIERGRTDRLTELVEDAVRFVTPLLAAVRPATAPAAG